MRLTYLFSVYDLWVWSLEIHDSSSKKLVFIRLFFLYFNHNQMLYIWCYIYVIYNILKVKTLKTIIMCLIFMAKMLCLFTQFIHIFTYVFFMFMGNWFPTWFCNLKTIKKRIHFTSRLQKMMTLSILNNWSLMLLH